MLQFRSTVVRTLETVAAPDGAIHPGAGDTSLFIYPPYSFRAVDRLQLSEVVAQPVHLGIDLALGHLGARDGDLEAGVAGQSQLRPDLDHGVEVVWITIPSTRTVRVITRAGASKYGAGERLPSHPSLPGLSPRVDDLFSQLPSSQ